MMSPVQAVLGHVPDAGSERAHENGHNRKTQKQERGRAVAGNQLVPYTPASNELSNHLYK